jgi:hypothetical protein
LRIVTGLVFDLPHAPWMGDVMRLRAAYDLVRLRFPIEITVVGSSGLGWFSLPVAREALVHKVREVARTFSPFTFRFGSLKRFPSSNVYYLQPLDDKPFHAFQATLAATNLSFEPTPYRYVPHCTVAEVSGDVATTAHEQLMQCPVPDHDIHVTSVSFYTVDRETQRCHQHERVALGV